MINLPQTLPLPMKLDKHGVIRVSGTRVTLDTLLAWLNQGETPEELHEGFPTVPLADIYAIIAYYLANREQVDAYLQHNREIADRLQTEIEANYPPHIKESIEQLKKLKDETHKDTKS